jgi:hypothetical protein
MFGLEKDAIKKTLTFVPHIPADWTDFKIKNVRVGDSVLDLSYHKTLGEITLEVTRTGGECALDFQPALANTAWNVHVDVNGRPQTFDQQISAEHHHLRIQFALKEGTNTIRLHVPNDFGVSYPFRLPELGAESSDLRILSEEMAEVTAPMVLETSGRAGATYELSVWNPGLIESVQGAELVKDTAGETKLRVRFDANTDEDYKHQRVIIYFHPQKLPKKLLKE